MNIRQLEKNEIEHISGYQDHDAVYECIDESSGLHAFVALHIEHEHIPAVGGTRFFAYESMDAALQDVLRLSHAMTQKCVMAGVPYVGGKAVIIGDSVTDKSPELLEAYAHFIDTLGGKFYTGEDVGISEENVQLFLKHSPYFIGSSSKAGDPSPYASLSVFTTLTQALDIVYGDTDFSKRHVAVKGVGKVGSELVRLLVEAGAKVTIADVSLESTTRMQALYPEISVVSPDVLHMVDCDVFSPCAMGNDLTMDTIKPLQCDIVCGGANNQLASIEVGDALYTQKVLYVPDVLANAGGLINVVDELDTTGYVADRVLQRIEDLKKRLSYIYEQTQQHSLAPQRIVERMVDTSEL